MDKPRDKIGTRADGDRRGRRLTATEIESIFQFWCEHDQDVAATARQFSCHRDTVYNHIRKRGWKKRAEGIAVDIAKRVDKTIATQELTTIKVARMMLGKESKAYEKRGGYDGDPKVILLINAYLDRAQGTVPDEGHGDNIVNLYEKLSPDEQERVRDNALSGLTDGISGDRGPFSPVPSGCVRTSE